MRASARFAAILAATALAVVPGSLSQIRDRVTEPSAAESLRGLTRFHVAVNRVEVASAVSTSGLAGRMESTIEQWGLDAVTSGEVPVINTPVPLRSNPPDLVMDLTALELSDGSVMGFLRLHVDQTVKRVMGRDDATVDQDDSQALADDPDDVFIRATSWQTSGYFISIAQDDYIQSTMNQTIDSMLQRFLTDHRSANPTTATQSRSVLDVLTFWN